MVHAISVPAQTQPDQVYTNVMETLVADEVDRQLDKLPPRVLRFIKRAEVETYALNRLPALYASSTQGFTYQRKRAQREFKVQLAEAVRQALAAVQVDPLRLSNPLDVNANGDAQAVLEALKTTFNRPDLDWSTALQELKRLQNVSQDNTASDQSRSNTAWRPGTYSSRQLH
ncbi:MAG: late competence development ComFB family protein [Cyanobacteria bacterium]|nr:late competence development ComFB family protein [Cyanobacteriota bacterium]